jgi:hypothetical protein
MSIISRSIPGLFGGVSQQIPAMRHPTHCEVQENGIATLVEGLAKREGVQHIKSLAMTGANSASVQGTNGAVFVHVIDRGGSGRFLLIIKNGNLMVYDLATGAPKTVTFPDGKGYLTATTPSTLFRAVSVADYTFLVNRSTTVAMTGGFSASRPINRGLIYVKQAVASLAHRITVDGTTVTYTSTATPTIGAIVTGLIAALNAGLPAGYTVAQVAPPGETTGPVISIIRNSGAATAVSCSDDFGNLSLLAVHDSVKAYSDLPPSLGGITNFVTKVSLNPSSDKGAFWVTWDTTLHEYKECAAPGISDTLDNSTLPHKLVLNVDGTFTMSRITDWTTRKAGDDNSNPLPSFVGGKLNDVFFFRNRLGVLSSDGAILSKAGKYYSFFSDSAQTVLDTDPIDLANPTEQVVELLWAVPFNQNLLLWADRQQFVLTGGDVLSPKNARMVPTTAFEAYLGSRPEPLGNKCAFATTSGDYTALRLLKVSLDTVTNQADDLTEHAPRYIPNAPVHIKASSTAKTIAVLPSGTGSSMFLFKYEVNEQDVMTQRAWKKLTFPDTGTQTSKIVKVYWVDRRLYIVRFIQDTLDAAETGGRFVLELLDFQVDRKDTNVDFSLRLDRKVLVTGASYNAGTDTTSFSIPYWERNPLTLLKCVTGRAPAVMTASSTVFNADGTMTIQVPKDVTTAAIWIGKAFLFRYVFTEVFFRDENNAPVQSCVLALKKVLLRFKDTGFFRCTVTPLRRETWTYEFTGNVLGTIPLEAPQLASGAFSIPINSKAEGTVIEIQSDSFFPAKFPYADWVGDITMKAQR